MSHALCRLFWLAGLPPCFTFILDVAMRRSGPCLAPRWQGTNVLAASLPYSMDRSLPPSHNPRAMVRSASIGPPMLAARETLDSPDHPHGSPVHLCFEDGRCRYKPCKCVAGLRHLFWICLPQTYRDHSARKSQWVLRSCSHDHCLWFRIIEPRMHGLFWLRHVRARHWLHC